MALNNNNNKKTRKPRVLVMYKCYSKGGGAEKNLLEVSRYMSSYYDLSFLVTGGEVDAELYSIGPVHIFPSCGRILLFPFDIIYFAYLLIVERINLTHSHHRYPAFIASIVAPIFRVKTLTTVHNVFPDKSGLSRWGDRLIAVSNKVSTWLIDECKQNPDQISIIYNGIEHPSHITNDKCAEIRKRLDVPLDACMLCSVGRLSPQKNYRMLLDALGAQKSGDWVLALIGEGEQLEILKNQARDLGISKKVRFLGFRSDVTDLLQAADIFVMSSSWEGFPYVIIEALASRLPVIATNVGGISEAVIDNHNGYLVHKNDTSMLADRINELIHNPGTRKNMADAGEKLFLERFTASQMFENMGVEYQNLLGED